MLIGNAHFPSQPILGTVATMIDERIQRLRTDYESTPLSMSDTADDPIEQFDRWFSEAIAAEVDEPNAMVVSTVSADGAPSSRAVLMKSYDAEGLVFYTNTDSRKGSEIGVESRVSLLFVWLPLHRQVRVEGVALRVSDSEADAYFTSRPIEARISAAASPQSSIIPSRRWLEDRVATLRASPSGSIERPPSWGGYRVKPSSVEFWQGRPSRLHDRIRYETGTAGWAKVRLAP
jgi:pyridoxamine 5'-phosphate oxidase